MTDTVVRILTREREPRTTAYLVDETERLVRHLLADGYNIPNAVRNSVYTSELIEWSGPSTFRCIERDSAPISQRKFRGRGKTSNHIHDFLMDNGPAHTDDIIQHMQETFSTKETTIRDAIYRDTGKRFLRLEDRRMAANPAMLEHNPETPTIVIIPDERLHRPAPVLLESELAWLTRYLKGLSELAPPLPCRVAITGPRAASFAHEGDTVEVTVVLDFDHRPSLEPRLAKCVAEATEAVPSVQPNIRIISTEQWTQQRDGRTPVAHHNVWLPPDTATRRARA